MLLIRHARCLASCHKKRNQQQTSKLHRSNHPTSSPPGESRSCGQTFRSHTPGGGRLFRAESSKLTSRKSNIALAIIPIMLLFNLIGQQGRYGVARMPKKMLLYGSSKRFVSYREHGIPNRRKPGVASLAVRTRPMVRPFDWFQETGSGSERWQQLFQKEGARQ